MKIRNVGIDPSINDFTEAFAGRSIYSIYDLYSDYDQFQLAIDRRDITTIRTPIGLIRMCTLPEGATNTIARMVNAMKKVLIDCIPEISTPCLDGFVVDQIKDCEKVLQKLEYANLTLSGETSAFGQPKVLVVGHMAGNHLQPMWMLSKR